MGHKRSNARRSDGRIAVQVYAGRDDCGKRIIKTVYGMTQKEADEKARQIRVEIDNGANYVAGRAFSEWAELFLKAKSKTVSVRQQKDYRSRINYLCEQFGDEPLDKILPIHVQEVIDDIAKYNSTTGRPSSRRTLSAFLATMNQIYKYAIINRIVTYNPCLAVVLPKDAPKSTRRALTEQEQELILTTPHRAQTAAMIMLLAGLRRGEVIALTWDDIDLKGKTITINKSVEMEDNQASLKAPKTQAGNRVVYIPTRLADYLSRLKVAHRGLVCPSASGTMMSATAWKRLWESYMSELNAIVAGTNKFAPKRKKVIIDFTAHMLRHTYATMLYLSGIDVLAAKEQLGHADVKTTLGVYTHLDGVYKKKSMEKLDKYLSDKHKNSSD